MDKILSYVRLVEAALLILLAFTVWFGGYVMPPFLVVLFIAILAAEAAIDGAQRLSQR